MIDYLRAMQDAIEKASKGIEKVDEAPAITLNLNQQNITVQSGEEHRIDRASQIRVEEAVKAILRRTSSVENTPIETYDMEEDEDGNN